MAFDAARKTIVLFGGTTGGSAAPLNDTWVWDGDNWKQVLPAHRPPGRFWHTMSYDPVHGQIVLFGGDGGDQILNDTWLWDGKDWRPAGHQTTPPALRTSAAMDYDPITGKLVMFSGTVWNLQRNGLIAIESWNWDGFHWTKLPDSKFHLIKDFSQITPADAKGAILGNGTPSYIFVPMK